MAAQSAEDSISPTPQPNSTLCEKCHTWNDVAFLSLKSQLEDYYRVHAVDIPMHAACPDCAICAATYTAAKTRLEWERSEGRTYAGSLIARNLGPLFLDNKFTPGDRVDYSRSGESRLLVVIQIRICELAESSLAQEPGTANISFHEPKVCKDAGYQELLRMAPRFCLRHSRYAPTHLLGVDAWETPFFDVGLLKSWISSCEGIHAADTSPSSTEDDTYGTLPVDFRLIDIQCMNITRPNPGEPFVALSYMWHTVSPENAAAQLERANLHSLGAVNGLRDISLPDIIADTIALCRALGERYLWVDRLCIVQDDEVSKHGQIRAMNSVYSSAKLTIMAALNKSKTSVGLSGCPKLPGCPGRPRLPSAMDIWQFYDVKSRSICQMWASVEDSAWNQRAWTFQERFLSRCRLFITESQVYFQCNGGRLSAFEHRALASQRHNGWTKYDEDEAADTLTTGLTLKPIEEGQGQVQLSNKFPGYDMIMRHGDNISFKKPDDMSFLDWRSIMLLYTPRQLSFRSDILKAFAGISNVFARGYKTRMLFGLPEKYFHLALLWHTSRHRHLADWEAESAANYAPSWSWASTQCLKEYSSWIDTNIDLDLIHFYYYESESTDLAQVSTRKIDADIHLHRGPHWKLRRPTLREFFSNSSSVLAQTACEVARRLEGSLIFNTATIICRLGPLGKSLGGRHPDSERLFSQALLVQPNNMSMGNADIDSKWTKESKIREGDEIKIVVIAVRRLTGSAASEGPHAFNKEVLDVLDVLLVEPDHREPLAVRRIGVGCVRNWELWLSCNPRWETVVLS